MISKISGTLADRTDTSIVLDVGGLGYEVLVPLVVLKALETAPMGQKIELETIYYLAIEQTRATPILLGFQNEIQKEFFEKLTTVPRMGPKSALAVFSRPVSTVATAIESANVTVLQSLPGVGKQKARDMIATLQGKVAKFALMQDGDLDKRSVVPATDVAQDALQLLQALGHKRAEAEKLVAEALRAEPNSPDAETLVRVIYNRQRDAK
ncbi:MAG TPA: Holliday junction branch migration protein RuvA [Abditibacteriaceae bacterium]|jgi:Holliday junction DNA helicase RuvA